jgi:tetratricopeptide (TPR) repeat protein
LFISLNTPTKDELHNQLDIWGYYQERLELYNKLLGKLSYRMNATCLNGLGNTYLAIGNYAQAIECHQQQLAIERSLNNLRGECQAFNNLGNAYNSFGNYEKAIDCHWQSLTIALKIRNRECEQFALNNLGISYCDLGNYDKALDYHQRSLAIARELQNHQ